MGISVSSTLGPDEQVSGLVSHRALFFSKQTPYRSSTTARWKKQAPLVGRVWGGGQNGVEAGREVFHPPAPPLGN